MAFRILSHRFIRRCDCRRPTKRRRVTLGWPFGVFVDRESQEHAERVRQDTGWCRRSLSLATTTRRVRPQAEYSRRLHHFSSFLSEYCSVFLRHYINYKRPECDSLFGHHAAPLQATEIVAMFAAPRALLVFRVRHSLLWVHCPARRCASTF